jgi:hypothetical protein
VKRVIVYMIGWIQFPIHAVLYDSGGDGLAERHVGGFTLWASVSICQCPAACGFSPISGTLILCIIKQRAYIALPTPRVRSGAEGDVDGSECLSDKIFALFTREH